MVVVTVMVTWQRGRDEIMVVVVVVTAVVRGNESGRGGGGGDMAVWTAGVTWW